MSDNNASYNAGTLPQTLNAFKNRNCARLYTDDNYTAPTPEEVNQLIILSGWSQNDAAKLVGVKWDTKKGSSTIRKWKSEKAKKDHREIPYSAWRLLLIYAGVVNLDNHLNN